MDVLTIRFWILGWYKLGVNEKFCDCVTQLIYQNRKLNKYIVQQSMFDEIWFCISLWKRYFWILLPSLKEEWWRETMSMRWFNGFLLYKKLFSSLNYHDISSRLLFFCDWHSFTMQFIRLCSFQDLGRFEIIAHHSSKFSSRSSYW